MEWVTIYAETIQESNKSAKSENKNKSGVTKGNIGKKWVNPFWSNVLFLYLLITSENQRFSDVFRGYRNGTLV